MADRSLQIRPITGALGAEIAEIDLSADLDDGTVAATRRAWLDHLAIFFRGQNLPPERLLAFARRRTSIRGRDYAPSGPIVELA